jgi:hypothetical protein
VNLDYAAEVIGIICNKNLFGNGVEYLNLTVAETQQGLSFFYCGIQFCVAANSKKEYCNKDNVV